MNWRNTILPEVTDSYTPVAHSTIVDGLAQRGYSVVNVFQNAAGTVIAGKAFKGGDFSPSVAFINSYNKRHSLKLAAGLVTKICMNGAIMGDIRQLRRHTGNVEVESYLDRMVLEAENAYDNNLLVFDQLKQIKVDKLWMSHVLGQLFVDEVLSVTQANEVRKQMVKPSYQYGAKDTVYEFYQHCTHAIKSQVDNSLEAHQGVHNLILEYI